MNIKFLANITNESYTEFDLIWIILLLYLKLLMIDISYMIYSTENKSINNQKKKN